MKNSFIDKFRSVIKIRVKGKNLERFIRRLVTNKIPLLNIHYPNHNEVLIKIYKEDYEKINEIKTIYDVEMVNTYGLMKIKYILNVNRILLICLLLGIIFLILLSNIIFKIEVIHNNDKLRKLLTDQLAIHGIKEYKFKKNYEQIQKIKKQILNDYKDKIEWLEIQNVGTKYIVRVEERKLPSNPIQYRKQHVVAKKSAIIKKIEAKSGEIIKNINDYVKEGDIIISGEIKVYDNIKDIVKAEGTVYGEVWYEVSVDYPFVQTIKKETGRKNNVYVIKFLNREIELFNFNHFKNKIKKDKNIINHFLLPFSLVKQHQKEIEVIENIYTQDEATIMALELARKQMLSKLNDKEKIIDQKNLKVTVKDSKIVVDVFFTVYEDITSYIKIEEIKETE